MKILLATNNLGKIREFEFLFNNSDFKLIPLHEFSDKEIPETGNSYEENAFLKAKEAYRITKLPVLADDSGLEVESIGNKPGIFSARFAGQEANDDKNNKKLLKELQNKSNRTAKYVSVLCFYNPKEKIEIYTYGELRGSIGKKEKGSLGFGYDPLFNLKNTRKTMAEISFEERMNISHRTQSTKKIIAELNKLQSN